MNPPPSPRRLGALALAPLAFLLLAGPAPAQTDSTTALVATALVGSCEQIRVTAPFLGDENGDGHVLVQFNTANSWPGTTACAALTGPSPRECLLPALAATTSYWLRVSYFDPDGVSGAAVQVLPDAPFVTPSCSGDGTPPTVSWLAPARGAVIGGTEGIKIQVFDSPAVAAANVLWSVDGGAWTNAGVVWNDAYDCDVSAQTTCRVFEFPLNTTADPDPASGAAPLALADGAHFVSVRASDATANVDQRSRAVIVRNAGARPAGSGHLLRRAQGSQLCLDCHAIASHSSQTAGTDYGTWAVECLDCHIPHGTTNIFLVRELLATPNSGVKTILFHFDDAAGGTNPGSAPGNYSYLGDKTVGVYDDGICEACHTRTRFHGTTGNPNHQADRRCVRCHTHANGFVR